MSIEKQLGRLADVLAVLAEGAARGRMLFRVGSVGELPLAALMFIAPTHQFQKSPTGAVLAMFQITDSQQATATVVFKDKRNNPASIDGQPSWSVDNSELLAITPSADGMSCVFASVGPLGIATITVKADADLGDGMKPIVGSLEVEISAGDAAVIEITAGEPSEQE
jgi:hypothetical protein